MVGLSRPGALFLMWCFYASRSQLPWIRFDGPSKLSGAIEPGETTASKGKAMAVASVSDGDGNGGCEGAAITGSGGGVSRVD